MSYVVVGSKVIDSQQILDKIEKELNFKGVKDITKGSKREDTIIFQVYHHINALKDEIDAEELGQMTNEEIIDELMELADEKTSIIEEYIPRNMLAFSYSYYFDEAEERIKSVFIAVDEEVGEPRLRDIAERILRSID